MAALLGGGADPNAGRCSPIGLAFVGLVISATDPAG